MTENLAEDLPHADDSILGSSSSNSSDDDDHRQTSYAENRKSKAR